MSSWKSKYNIPKWFILKEISLFKEYDMIMKMQHEIAKEEIKESTMDCNKTFFSKMRYCKSFGIHRELCQM